MSQELPPQVENVEPTQEEIVEAVYSFAAERMHEGADAQQIHAELMQQGLDQDSASQVVSNLFNMRTDAVRSAGKKNMIYGALWCIGGVVVTVVTFSMAANGGSYIVTWGAILFGAIQFFRGAYQATTGNG